MNENNPLIPLLCCCGNLGRERMEARLAPYDVTTTQTYVLIFLSKRGGEATQSELTRFLNVRPSTANGILDRLCDKNMVERTISQSDARCRIITLTEKGRERARFIEEYLWETEELLGRGFTQEEKETLSGLLYRVLANLKEDREQC